MVLQNPNFQALIIPEKTKTNRPKIVHGRKNCGFLFPSECVFLANLVLVQEKLQ
jgi:hypothetical protein